MITAVKERGILFSGPMVRAILSGRKTQTRRPIKKQPKNIGGCYSRPDGEFIWLHLPHQHGGVGVGLPFVCPFGQPGDRLWVRETWAVTNHEEQNVEYRATWPESLPPFWGKWKPSLHMPRWASRITLEITEVRVEKLQQIKCSEVEAEGYIDDFIPNSWMSGYDVQERRRDLFLKSWDSLYAEKGYGWEANPWVWCVEFKRSKK